MTTYQVDPISRIEGHLGVKLTVDGTNKVTAADVHGNLWRGFENFLIGRVPNDAITFTQRICGVCPVPHGMTSTYAVEAALGYNNNFQTFSNLTNPNGVTPKAMYMRNLILGSEFLMSSLTHFYHLAAPSYVQGPAIPPWTPYFQETAYSPLLVSKGHGIDALGAYSSVANTQGALPALSTSVAGFPKDLWSAVITQYVKALRIRRLTFEAGAMFSGRMPMTSAFIAGGVGFKSSTSLTTRINKFRELTSEIGNFVIQEYVPLVLALGALYGDYDNSNNVGYNPDDMAVPRAGKGYGGGCGNFLAWGGFPQDDGSLGMSKGYIRTGKTTGYGLATPVTNLAGLYAPRTLAITEADVRANLTEEIKHSRYAQDAATGYPTDSAFPGDVSRTKPVRNQEATKYSWLKAPRWKGDDATARPMEVGPMARMFVMGLFQTDQYLAVTADLSAAGLVGFADYAIAHTGTGAVTVGANQYALRPSMIEPGLAVALVRSGLAAVYAQNGTTVIANQATIDAIPQATLVAVYQGTSAYGQCVITGAVTTFILSLKAGLSTMDRLRGRAIESLYTVQKMLGKPTVANDGSVTWPPVGATAGWLGKLNTYKGQSSYVVKPTPTSQVLAKFGATEAPRGALMHFVSINNGKILRYQCVVPTTWNGSPKGVDDVTNGPIEQAMMGIPFAPGALTPAPVSSGTGHPLTVVNGGYEALRVAQSFDPCIACAVH